MFTRLYFQPNGFFIYWFTDWTPQSHLSAKWGERERKEDSPLSILSRYVKVPMIQNNEQIAVKKSQSKSINEQEVIKPQRISSAAKYNRKRKQAAMTVNHLWFAIWENYICHSCHSLFPADYPETILSFAISFSPPPSSHYSPCSPVSSLSHPIN